jgi:hypothetical protein
MVLQMSDEYRSARKLTTLLCALSLAWSAAQIDLKVFKLELFNDLDLSGAAIDLILFLAVLYSSVRSTLEFSMQAVEVRRWKPAQLDFTLSLNIARITLLVLAASGFSRAIQTVVYVVIFMVCTLVFFAALLFVGTLMFSWFFMRYGKDGARKSVAASSIAAVAWAQIAVIFLFSFVIVAAGIAMNYSEPFRTLWPTPPAFGTRVFFVTATALVFGSFVFQGLLYRKLFSRPTEYVESISPDGEICRAYIMPTQPTWDWSNVASPDEQPTDGRT